MLFGAGAFDDFFPCPFISFPLSDHEQTLSEEEQAQRVAEMRAAEAKRLAALFDQLLGEMSRARMDSVHYARAPLKKRLSGMADAPGGTELIGLLGYVYDQEARRLDETALFGITSFLAKVQERGHMAKRVISTASSAAAAQAAANDESGKRLSDEEKLRMGLRAIWKAGILDIEMMVRAVVAETFANLTGYKREDYVHQMAALGEICHEISAAGQPSDFARYTK